MLDTVVYVRGLINRRSPSVLILFQITGKFRSVTSPAIVAEIFDVLARSRLRARFPDADDISWERVLSLIATSEIVVPTTPLDLCRDPNDNKFFECAVQAHADYIVSEDRDVLDVGEYQGVRTVTTEEFIRILETE